MISVVIPCYNRAALVSRAISSALAQGHIASQVIVVDDGSTDNTKEVCAQYAHRIDYVWQKRAGPSVARNAGVKYARNDWVAFLDSDDYWTPTHLARIGQAIEETDGEACFYFSDMQMGERKGSTTLWKMVNFAPPRRIQLAKDGTNWVFLSWHPMMLQSSVFRREVLLKRGALDPQLRLRHDSELFFRLSVGNKICAVSNVGCIQTDGDTSSIRLTTDINPEKATYWQETIELWRRLHEFPNLSVLYRRAARHALASSHWRLFRLHWRPGNRHRGALHLWMAGWNDPSFIFSLITNGHADVNARTITAEYD